MLKVLTIFGTRPEAIKLAPVLVAFSKQSDLIESRICITAQHREMLDEMLNFFDIVPHIDLNAMNHNQSLSDLSASLVPLIDSVFKEEKPDFALVQGDTTTAMLTAMVAYYNKVPVGHIEAGLRTYDRYNPFPEEINRRMISTLSTIHFAPTQRALKSLQREGFDEKTIFLTGNTIVDALMSIKARLNENYVSSLPIPQSSEKKLLLVTAHRRENFGLPLRNICKALKTIATLCHEIEIFYPVHPNPNVKEVVFDILSSVANIHLLPPLSYLEFVYLLSKCSLVLTDSGGVQEEAPAFSKPILVLRKITERPELVENGLGKVIGTDPDDIVMNVQKSVQNLDQYPKISSGRNPFGDGKASMRICNIIRNFFVPQSN
ncbi:MAG: non-hydrolyzing UDP-N-acetylglucosamine 2-epimerase [bacterium]